MFIHDQILADHPLFNDGFILAAFDEMHTVAKDLDMSLSLWNDRLYSFIAG